MTATKDRVRIIDTTVLSDDWYSTNLKAIIVGNADPIAARLQGPQGMPSHS